MLCRFVWCLFWFDVAYVLVCLLHSACKGLCARLGARSRVDTPAAASATAAAATPAAADKPSQVQQQEHVLVDFGASSRAGPGCEERGAAAAEAGASTNSSAAPAAVVQEYSLCGVLVGVLLLTLAFTLVSSAAVMATYDSNKVCCAQLVHRLPIAAVVQHMGLPSRQPVKRRWPLS